VAQCALAFAMAAEKGRRAFDSGAARAKLDEYVTVSRALAG